MLDSSVSVVDTEGMTTQTPTGGRPPIGPQHPVRCSPAEWRAVERLAGVNGVTRSAQARRLIVLGLRVVTEQATPDGGES